MIKDNILELIGRTEPLFDMDIKNNEKELNEIISSSRFLVVGGAGSKRQGKRA